MLDDKHLADNYRNGVCRCEDCHGAYIRETDRYRYTSTNADTMTVDKLIAAKHMLMRPNMTATEVMELEREHNARTVRRMADFINAPYGRFGRSPAFDAINRIDTNKARDMYLDAARKMREPPMFLQERYLRPGTFVGLDCVTDCQPKESKMKTAKVEVAKPVSLPVQVLQFRLNQATASYQSYEGHRKAAQNSADNYKRTVAVHSKEMRELKAALKKLGVK